MHIGRSRKRRVIFQDKTQRSHIQKSRGCVLGTDAARPRCPDSGMRQAEANREAPFQTRWAFTSAGVKDPRDRGGPRVPPALDLAAVSGLVLFRVGVRNAEEA